MDSVVVRNRTQCISIDISHPYSNKDLIQKGMVKKIGAKKYETNFLCPPILNYCIVIVSVRYE
jgi:hypothetical protein